MARTGNPPFIPLNYTRPDEVEMRERARGMLESLATRRSVRHFSPEPVPMEVLEDIIATACQAPSGANRQPWRFVLVTDAETKRKIREAAEAEEKESYERRMPQEWLDALEPLGTDWHKEFLEIAPALIVIFRKEWEKAPDGTKVKGYYVWESVGLAAGFLIAAIHHAGLACLTHTPSPMKFLSKILGRPPEEKPFLLLPVGYPAEGCQVPNIDRYPLDKLLTKL
jgi:iodotyrosine deiodinase